MAMAFQGSPTGLRGKLSDLAVQMAKIQRENDSIRSRYVEMEAAWQTMGLENRELKGRVATLESDLDASNRERDAAKAIVSSLEDKLRETHEGFLSQRNFASETKDTLVSEQMQLERKSRESDVLRRESIGQLIELKELRDAWDEREARMDYLQEQREFYSQSLSELGESYQALVDKLSFAVSDYTVRTAPIQVRIGGGYELLSNYLNRVFEQHDLVTKKHAKLAAPPMSPRRPQKSFPMPVSPVAHLVNKGQPL